MTGYMEFYLIAALAVVLVGYLTNAFTFLSTDRLPMLRLFDGKSVTTTEAQKFC